MSQRRWAIVNKSDRAGQRPRGWPVAVLPTVFPEESAAVRALAAFQRGGITDIEAIEVKLQDGDWPMWIQVGSDVSG